MKLYNVYYRAWNDWFTELISYNMLAVGDNAEDAIRRAKEITDSSASNFSASEIKNVMGFGIHVDKDIS